jgi:septum site-determining protein MinC
MSATPNPEDATRTPSTNGLGTFHTRIADLLDDVTVESAASATPAAAAVSDKQNVMPATDNNAPAVAPQPRKTPAAPADMASFFAPMPDAATQTPGRAAQPAPPSEENIALPGERLVSPARRPASPSPSADLPPFLVKPVAVEEQPAPPIGADRVPAPADQAVTDQAVTDQAVTDQAAVEQPVTSQLVNIRGRSDGITVEVGRGVWHEILGTLTNRLEQSAGFFRNGSVALDVGARPVVEDELKQMAALLTTFEMKLGVVRTSSERTFQAALATGITATLESPEGAPVAAAAPAATNTDVASYFVYRGYLRSGHRLRRQENILVIGDINPGAEVISEGDILVWGRLRGVVHAGVGGNQRAIIAALDLEPTQMRIADVTTIGPDPKPGQPGRFFWKKSQHKRPEIARLVQNEIVFEEWDAARPGGLISLRRGAG